MDLDIRDVPQMIDRHQKGLIFGNYCPNTWPHLFLLSSARRPHPGGTTGAGEYPPAKAGAAGGHSGNMAMGYAGCRFVCTQILKHTTVNGCCVFETPNTVTGALLLDILIHLLSSFCHLCTHSSFPRSPQCGMWGISLLVVTISVYCLANNDI